MLNDRENQILRKILAENFSLSELEELAANLNIRWDSFPIMSKTNYDREIVAHCQRHGTIAKLRNAILRVRPHVEKKLSEIPPRDNHSISKPKTYSYNATNSKGSSYLPNYSTLDLKSPFLGLQTYGYQHRTKYGGREALIGELSDKLVGSPTPPVVNFVVGKSGSGKSSFVQAGLLPELIRRFRKQKYTPKHCVIRPGSDPALALKSAYTQLGFVWTDARDYSCLDYEQQVNIIVIDQFEELLGETVNVDERKTFVSWLTLLPAFDKCRTLVIATLRSDFIGEFVHLESGALWRFVDNSTPLQKMSESDIREAILKPIRTLNADIAIEQSLLDKLVNEATVDDSRLPLLQVSLNDLWRKRHLITSNYRNLADAIRTHANNVYSYVDFADITPSRERSDLDKAEILSIFQDLVGGDIRSIDRFDIRKTSKRESLEFGSPRRKKLIRELINARLLTLTISENMQYIDIVHESLISEWDLLSQAILVQREKLQRRMSLEYFYGVWVREDKSTARLLQGIQLAEAELLLEEKDLLFRNDPNLVQFVEQSRQLDEQRKEMQLDEFRQLIRLSLWGLKGQELPKKVAPVIEHFREVVKWLSSPELTGPISKEEFVSALDALLDYIYELKQLEPVDLPTKSMLDPDTILRILGYDGIDRLLSSIAKAIDAQKEVDSAAPTTLQSIEQQANDSMPTSQRETTPVHDNSSGNSLMRELIERRRFQKARQVWIRSLSVAERNQLLSDILTSVKFAEQATTVTREVTDFVREKLQRVNPVIADEVYLQQVRDIYRRNFKKLDASSSNVAILVAASIAFDDVKRLNIRSGKLPRYEDHDDHAIYVMAGWLKDNLSNDYISRLTVRDLAEAISHRIEDYTHNQAAPSISHKVE